jgi:o-succinylbenzoate---CoA ligase
VSVGLSLIGAPWRGGAETALIHAGTALDYRGLESLIGARIQALRVQGLAPGAVVMAPDAPVVDGLVMQLSLAHLDAVFFPHPARIEGPELDRLADLTSAEWRWVPGENRLHRLSRPGPRTVCEAARAIRLLIRTSGSGGSPKVAMLSSQAILTSAAATNVCLGLDRGDLWLSCLRQSHIGGASIGYRCAMAGAAVLLHDGFDAPAVAEDLFRWPVTHLSLVPPMLARLLDLLSSPPPRLRVLLLGGQALSPALAERALSAGWPLHVTYGMTETASQIAIRRMTKGAPPDPELVGRPWPGVDVDASGCGETPRPLRVRGPCVMAGYANPERRPGQGLVAGWLETADLACREDDGQVRILGRADEALVIGGLNISPLRIEHLLAAAPGVRECAVVGLPDEVWGHRLGVAFAGETDEARLEAWCRSNLRSPERPRAYLRLARLPALDSGKPDRTRLVALFAGQATRTLDPGP